MLVPASLPQTSFTLWDGSYNTMWQNVRFNVTLKCKDRIDFYPCITDVPIDASDCTCHKFIAEVVYAIWCLV